MTKQIETVIAQFQAELVLALRVKTSVAFETGRERWSLGYFASNNFGMDFNRVHEKLPRKFKVHASCQLSSFLIIDDK